MLLFRIRYAPPPCTGISDESEHQHAYQSHHHLYVQSGAFVVFLRYGIAYVKSEREIDGKIESTDQKHIMRYQQMFAAMAIQDKIDAGIKSGFVWHTQGSGKTALSYYLTKVLTDYFAGKQKVAKFYFIVDRLDLLEQASQEFEARGLEVKTANSRAELMEQFRNNRALEGNSGQLEITVVNIQRFAEDNSRVCFPYIEGYILELVSDNCIPYRDFDLNNDMGTVGLRTICLRYDHDNSTIDIPLDINWEQCSAEGLSIRPETVTDFLRRCGDRLVVYIITTLITRDNLTLRLSRVILSVGGDRRDDQ